MEAGTVSSALSIHAPATTSLHKRCRISHLRNPKILSFPLNSIHSRSNIPHFSSLHRNIVLPISSSSSSTTVSTDQVVESPTELEISENYEQAEEEGRFDWYAQWYPIMPVCDLDKRVPHAKRVMGLDVVVWWDRNENAWKVFNDMCPHRLAPLSEGRIDQWGRLQCVYHGWCFNGSGDCKFIPQLPLDGPPVHTSKKACVSVYPSTLQNDIVWFWPNTDPQYKDILSKKQPPYIPELDDPSYTRLMGNRDISYGYEVLIENLMDPSHVPYAHYKIMKIPNSKKRVTADREGGRPVDMKITELDINGFFGKTEWGNNRYMAPCIYYAFPPALNDQTNGSVPSGGNNKVSSTPQRRALLIFICIPVSPGKSRLIWSFPRNFGKWIDQVVPRWMFHVNQNLILDSDLYLLHVEEHKIREKGPENWQKACFVPAKADASVVAYRKWLKKYSNGQVDWRGKFGGGALPPTPPREQLLDRYWTHVVNCRSCSAAHKALNALEVVLQVVAISLIGIVAATNQRASISGAGRIGLIAVAMLCFGASKWLSHFIYKTFHFHDYYHALQ